MWVAERPMFRGSRVLGFGVQFLDLPDGEFIALAALVEHYCRLWEEGTMPTA